MPTGLDIDLAPLDAHQATGVILALSGGLDSTVLLHALSGIDAVRARGLRAVHVHHGLHPDADAWEAHCARSCAALDVPFEAVRVPVERDGRGLEDAARRARHAALRARCGAGDVVAFAHHRDDQAETFLLRALRASGPDGLAAMRPWRRFGTGWLWRPLLDTPREALDAYARAWGLTWIDDPSNTDDAPDRNYLRLHVLPTLRARWPHAAAALAGAAAASREASDLLVADDAGALGEARIAPDELDTSILLTMQPARRARVLRRWIVELGLPPLPREGVRRLEHEVLAARPDAAAEFAWHGARIVRWRDRLHARRSLPPLDPGWSATWAGPSRLLLPDGGSLRLEPPLRFPEAVRVRARRGGERIRLPGRPHRHALKHVLQDRGIPPWERAHLPLLFDEDGELLAAGDAVVGARLQAWLDGVGARLLWARPSPPER